LNEIKDTINKDIKIMLSKSIPSSKYEHIGLNIIIGKVDEAYKMLIDFYNNDKIAFFKYLIYEEQLKEKKDSLKVKNGKIKKTIDALHNHPIFKVFENNPKKYPEFQEILNLSDFLNKK